MSRGIDATNCIRHFISCENTVLYRNRYSNIPITYTETRMRCYIVIISRILADSCIHSGLHVFIESLYNEYGKLFKKYTGKFCSVFNRILSEYGRIRCKKNPVMTVVLCSEDQCSFNCLRIYWNFDLN